MSRTGMTEYVPKIGEPLPEMFENTRRLAERSEGPVVVVFNGGFYQVRADDTFDEWVRGLTEGVPDFHEQIVNRLADPQQIVTEALKVTLSEEVANRLSKRLHPVSLTNDA